MAVVGDATKKVKLVYIFYECEMICELWSAIVRCINIIRETKFNEYQALYILGTD